MCVSVTIHTVSESDDDNEDDDWDSDGDGGGGGGGGRRLLSLGSFLPALNEAVKKAGWWTCLTHAQNDKADATNCISNQHRFW